MLVYYLTRTRQPYARSLDYVPDICTPAVPLKYMGQVLSWNTHTLVLYS